MFTFRLACLCVLFLASFSPVHADTKTLTADAPYIMGDGETPDFAEARTLQKAKQIALEEAGTYVQSYTKVQNLDLTTEDPDHCRRGAQGGGAGEDPQPCR